MYWGLCILVGRKELQGLFMQGIVEGPYLKFVEAIFGIWLIFEMSNFSILKSRDKVEFRSISCEMVCWWN